LLAWFKDNIGRKLEFIDVTDNAICGFLVIGVYYGDSEES
jgi:hypothetical protein